MKNFWIAILLLSCATGFSQTDGTQQEWKKTSCYSKISFQLVHQGTNGTRHIWKIRFKNDYENIISFNYHIDNENTDNQPTTHRKILYPKSVSAEQEIYTDTENVFIIVDKVSLSPYPQNFINCE